MLLARVAVMNFDYALFPFSISQEDIVFLEDCAKGVEAGAKITIEGIFEIGSALLAARARFGEDDRAFGQWRRGRLPWLEQHTAANFMAVASRFTRKLFPGKNILPTVLYQLASPSTPDSVIDEVLDRARSGEKVTVKQAKDLVRKAKDEANGNVYQFPLADSSALAVEALRERESANTQSIPELLNMSFSWTECYHQHYYALRDFHKHYLVCEADLSVSAAAFVSSCPDRVLQSDLSFISDIVDYLLLVRSGLQSRKEVVI